MYPTSNQHSIRRFIPMMIVLLVSLIVLGWLFVESQVFKAPPPRMALAPAPKPISIPELKEASTLADTKPAGTDEAIQPIAQPEAQQSPAQETQQASPTQEQAAQPIAIATAETTPEAKPTATSGSGVMGNKAEADQPADNGAATAADTTPDNAATASDASEATTEQASPNSPAPAEPEPATDVAEASEPAATAELAIQSGALAEPTTESGQAQTEAPPTPDQTATGSSTGQGSHSGWIYAGQYKDGAWVLSGLELDEKTLPESGQPYQLTWGANVRAAPPGRSNDEGTNLAKNVGYLADGKTIKVLTVKRSGSQGHIWLEIEY